MFQECFGPHFNHLDKTAPKLPARDFGGQKLDPGRFVFELKVAYLGP
jgi:hypothetical protein